MSSIRAGSWSYSSRIWSTCPRSTAANVRYAGSGTTRPERRRADSSRRSPYVSAAPQWTWYRPRVSMPPMSMHSIGQAWAHWKQVSHLSVPHSSYSSCRRPRNLGETSARASGYMIVTLGSKNRRRVSAIPFARPRPGMKLMRSRSPAHEDDGGRGHEQVEQRRRQEPLPGEVHELVDAHAGQGAAHPHEDEHERVRLEHEPEDTGDPVETDVRPGAEERDDEDVRQHEPGEQCVPPLDPRARDPERRGEDQGEGNRNDRGQQEQADAEPARVKRHLHGPGPRERRVPAAEEQRDGQGRDDEHVHVLGEEEEAEAHAGVLGRESGDDLGVRLGEVEGGAVRLRGRGDEEDQGAERLA